MPNSSNIRRSLRMLDSDTENHLARIEALVARTPMPPEERTRFERTLHRLRGQVTFLLDLTRF